jgi:hypothetical protein
MCFRIARALREYYRYGGLSAELERREYGSSHPELAWVHRQKHESDKAMAGVSSASKPIIGKGAELDQHRCFRRFPPARMAHLY